MKVKVSMLGRSTPIEIEVENNSAQEVLEVLGGAAKLFVNGTEATSETTISEGDSVAAVPKVEGGITQ